MKEYRVKPNSPLTLDTCDPDDTGEYKKTDQDKEKAKALTAQLIGKLDELQERLYANGSRAVLIVLQGMDTGGKDGTIKSVMSGMNPQGCKVVAFKAPSSEELGHDFLWRVHQKAPSKGQIGIFNRSHYEDVLIARVHKLVPKSVWSKRYAHINEFERLLADSNVKILKFFLHISKDEQKKRLEQRLADSNKRWKVSPADFEERKLWDQYMNAYEAALNKCSADWAPWYIIPANQKWFRNCAISQIIVEALESLDMKYPRIEFDPATIVIK
jgi:PPK2 family polyphosphate:nucleotide phosphotransferase